MESRIERIDRQDRKDLGKMYGVRRRVFEQLEHFPRKDRMVYNEFDALSNHYLLLLEGKVVGSVSVADLTGLVDILSERGINPDLNVAKITKLAVLPEARGYKTLNGLLQPVRQEVVSQNYDLVFAEIAPPSDRLNDPSRYGLAKAYERIGGLKQLGKINLDGIPTLIIGGAKQIKS
jgi:hypothetical protein